MAAFLPNRAELNPGFPLEEPIPIPAKAESGRRGLWERSEGMQGASLGSSSLTLHRRDGGDEAKPHQG